MEPKVPDDIYKTHLENNSELKSLCLLDDNHCCNLHVHVKNVLVSCMISVYLRVRRQWLPGGLCSYELGLFLRKRLCQRSIWTG